MGWIAISSCDPGDYRPQPRVKKSIFILCERIRGLPGDNERGLCMLRHIPPYSLYSSPGSYRGHDGVNTGYSYTPGLIIIPELRGCPHDILWFPVFNDCRCLHNPLVDLVSARLASVSKTIHRNILIVLFPLRCLTPGAATCQLWSGAH